MRVSKFAFSSRTRPAIAALFLSAMFLTTTLHADEARDQSRAAFRRGVTAAKDKDYATARDAFIEAYKLFPHPSILLNLGIARAKTGELVDAEQDLVKFIADDGGATADEMRSAQKTLADVREKLGTIALEVRPADAKVTLDGKPIVMLSGKPTPVRAIGGQHKLKVDAPNHKPSEQSVEVLAKVESSLTVELESTKPKGGEGPTTPNESGGISRSTVGWSLLGVGAALGAVGGFFGISSLSLQSKWNDKSQAVEGNEKAQGERYATYADILYISGAVVGGFGLYFLLTKSSSSSAATSAAKPRLLLGPTYAGVRGSF